MKNKLESYNKATQKLMQQATDLNVTSDTIFSLPEMVYLLRESFKYKLTYFRVFEEFPSANVDPSTGFCLISSYYIYKHTGGNKVWKLQNGSIHWWLEHRQTGTVFDITYTQFNEPFPYKMGVPEIRIETDPAFLTLLTTKAAILGNAAHIEK